MNNFEIAELIHKHIILNLTIRTLERDRKHISDLKINQALELWMEQNVNELQSDLRNVKSQLSKKGVKIQSEKKIDELTTEYEIIINNILEVRRYMNVALKNWVNEEVKRLLGLEYNTTDSARWGK